MRHATYAKRFRRQSCLVSAAQPLLGPLLLVAFISGCTLFAVPLNQGRSHSFTSLQATQTTDREEEVRIRRSLEESEAPSTRHGHVAAAVSTRAKSGTAATTVGEAKASSFEDAQVLGRQLANALSASRTACMPLSQEATDLLHALVSTTAGARGWFVTLLTDPNFEALFVPPMDDVLLQAIIANPEPNIKLMTMNVAMSTATELAHLARGHPDLAKASRMTRDRSTTLLAELMDRLPGLNDSVKALLSAVTPEEPLPDSEWVKFCDKWGYSAKQREAIRRQVAPLVTR